MRRAGVEAATLMWTRNRETGCEYTVQVVTRNTQSVPKRSDHFARRRPAHGALALLTLSLERQGAETLGRQLYLQIRERILSGRLAPGARLPSTRRLAEELSISRTVPLN